MSRRDSFNQEELATMIDDYKQNKEQESSIKKWLSNVGDSIENIMRKNNLSEFSTEKWTAKITTTQKEDFNEFRAIEILKETLSEDDLKKVVKTREYIDDDALESLVYNGVFDVAKLEPCRTLKEPTVTLRISKKK